MFELLFLMAFSLHNLEEGLWLPEWSKFAGKYHKKVEKNEFHFAVIIVTLFGYLLTFLNLVFGFDYPVIRDIYLGFVLMMVMNAVFPHLLAAIALKRYAPGLITGLLLNVPIGLYIIFVEYQNVINPLWLLASFVGVTVVVVASLNPLFKLGAKLIEGRD